MPPFFVSVAAVAAVAADVVDVTAGRSERSLTDAMMMCHSTFRRRCPAMARDDDDDDDDDTTNDGDGGK